jgi:hypothetical protein
MVFCNIVSINFVPKTNQMKKSILFASLLVLAINLSAQTRVGFKTGLAVASISTNDADLKSEKAMLPGFQVGVVVDQKISDQLSLQTQLLYLQKGTAIEHEGHKDKVRFGALDLPVQLLYHTKSGFFVGGGPNFGYNLSAKSIHETETEDIPFGNDAGEVKRVDLGLNLQAGYSLKNGLVVGVNVLRGLTNLQNVSGFEWRNNVVGINLIYFLPNASKKK